ncbi:MAG: M23 family metallopeptidase, partial [Puniceicoccales bacterium]
HLTHRKGFLGGVWIFLLGFLALVGAASGAERLPLVWPTPNRAFLEGKPLEDFVQPTASGRIESATYGGVRNGGYRFHEGLDLKPIERDRNRRPTDPVFAAMPGEVVYVNQIAGNSSYGKYVVLRHEFEGIEFYTLYAHLASAGEGIRKGVKVEQGASLGIMGSTAGGYTIPRSRAHLHFEIGLQMDSDFAWWYNRQRYGSKNQHGPWNGMNLAGWDPLEYYQLALAGKIAGPGDYLQRQPTAVRVRVPYTGVPDLIRRSPGLAEGDLSGSAGGWEVDFSEYGVPLRFRRLSVAEMGDGASAVEVVHHDGNIAFPKCKDLLDKKGSGYVPGKDLNRTLELIFGR